MSSQNWSLTKSGCSYYRVKCSIEIISYCNIETHSVHFVHNQIRHKEVPVYDEICIKVIIVFSKWIDLSLGNLEMSNIEKAG